MKENFAKQKIFSFGNDQFPLYSKSFANPSLKHSTVKLRQKLISSDKNSKQKKGENSGSGSVDGEDENYSSNSISIPKNFAYPSRLRNPVPPSIKPPISQNSELDQPDNSLTLDFYHKTQIEKILEQFQPSIIDEILAKRRDSEGFFEYLVKLDNSSFHHLQWLQRMDISYYINGQITLSTFQKIGIKTKEPFVNPLFEEPEMILGIKPSNENPLGLIKWRGLGFKYATWETLPFQINLDKTIEINSLQTKTNNDLNNNRIKQKYMQLYENFINREKIKQLNPEQIPKIDDKNITQLKPAGIKAVKELYSNYFNSKSSNLCCNISTSYIILSNLISIINQFHTLSQPILIITIDPYIEILKQYILFKNPKIHVVKAINDERELKAIDNYILRMHLFDVLLVTPDSLTAISKLSNFENQNWCLCIVDQFVTENSFDPGIIKTNKWIYIHNVFYTSSNNEPIISIKDELNNSNGSQHFEEILCPCPLINNQNSQYEKIISDRLFNFLDDTSSKELEMRKIYDELTNFLHHPMILESNQLQTTLLSLKAKYYNDELENDQTRFTGRYLDTGKLKVLQRIVAFSLKHSKKVLVVSDNQSILDIIELFFISSPTPAHRLTAPTTKSQKPTPLSDYTLLLLHVTKPFDWIFYDPDFVVFYDGLLNPFDYFSHSSPSNKEKHIPIFRLVTSDTHEELILPYVNTKFKLTEQNLRNLLEQTLQFLYRPKRDLLQSFNTNKMPQIFETVFDDPEITFSSLENISITFTPQTFPLNEYASSAEQLLQHSNISPSSATTSSSSSSTSTDSSSESTISESSDSSESEPQSPEPIETKTKKKKGEPKQIEKKAPQTKKKAEIPPPKTKEKKAIPKKDESPKRQATTAVKQKTPPAPPPPSVPHRIRLTTMKPGTMLSETELKQKKEIDKELLSEKVIVDKTGGKIIKRKYKVKLLKKYHTMSKSGKITRPVTRKRLTRIQEENLDTQPIRRRRVVQFIPEKVIKPIKEEEPQEIATQSTARQESKEDLFSKPSNINKYFIVQGENLIINPKHAIVPKFVEIPETNIFTDDDSRYIWNETDFDSLFTWMSKICWGRWEQIARNIGAIVSTGSIKESCYFLLSCIIKMSPNDYHPLLFGALMDFTSVWPQKYRKGMEISARNMLQKSQPKLIKKRLTQIEHLMAAASLVASATEIPKLIPIPQDVSDIIADKPTKSWTIDDDRTLITMTWMAGIPQSTTGIEKAFLWTGNEIPSRDGYNSRFERLMSVLLDDFSNYAEYPNPLVQHYKFPSTVFPDIPNEFYLEPNEQVIIGLLLQSYGPIDTEDYIRFGQLSSRSVEEYDSIITRAINAIQEESIPELFKCLTMLSIQFVEQIVKKTQVLIKARNYLRERKEYLASEDRSTVECILNYGLDKARQSPILQSQLDPTKLDPNYLRNTLKTCLKDAEKFVKKDPPNDTGYQLRLPLSLSNRQVIYSLGTPNTTNPHFWNEDYIYPPGFMSEITFPSTKPGCIDGDEKYRCTIYIRDDNEPGFRVTLLHSNDMVFEGNSPDDVWAKVIEYAEINDPQAFTPTIKTPGHEYFGLLAPLVTRFIQNMCSDCLPPDYIPRFYNKTIVFLRKNGLVSQTSDIKLPQKQSQSSYASHADTKPLTPQQVQNLSKPTVNPYFPIKRQTQNTPTSSTFQQSPVVYSAPSSQRKQDLPDEAKVTIHFGNLIHRYEKTETLYMSSEPFIAISPTDSSAVPRVDKLKHIFDSIDPSLISLPEKNEESNNNL